MTILTKMFVIAATFDRGGSNFDTRFYDPSIQDFIGSDNFGTIAGENARFNNRADAESYLEEAQNLLDKWTSSTNANFQNVPEAKITEIAWAE